MHSFYLIILSLLTQGILLSPNKSGKETSEFSETSTFHTETINPAYFSFAPTADCNPLSEFTENFNNTNVGEVPECWSTIRLNSSSNNVDLHVKPNANAISPPYDFQFANSSDDNATFYLVSPQLSTLSDGNHRLSFYYNKNGNDNVIVEVGTMSSSTNHTTFTSVATISTTAGYDAYTVDFDQESTDSYIAFKLSFSIGYSRVHLDNVSWEPTMDCSLPTALSFDDSGETTADLSWTPGEEETQWIVKYGEQGFDLETEGDVQEVNDSPNISLSDLTSNTQYQAYVKAVCAEDDESNYSGPINFYTGYCPGTAKGGSGSIDSFITTGGHQNINNQNTGSDQGYEDYTHMAVSQAPGNSFNFSASTTSATAGFAIYIDYNQDFTFDPSEKVYTSNGYASNVSGTITIPVDVTPGEYRLRLVSNWLNIDPEPCQGDNLGEIEDYTLIVLEIPTCATPENLNVNELSTSTAEISWTVGEEETQWEVIYGESGFDTDNEGTTQIVEETEITLVDLEENKTYDVYVRAICEEDLYSDWVGPETFTTEHLGVEDVVFKDFTYYPNPINSKLTLNATSVIEQATVYTILGQRVFETAPNVTTIDLDLGNLQAGSYLLQVQIDGITKTFKLIKQ